MIQITRLSHLAIRVTNLEKALYFYRDLLGFIETETKGSYSYLRGVEEGQHHSLVLKLSNTPGLSYIAFRVRSPEELDKAKAELEGYGVRALKFKEEGVNEAIKFESFNGIPIVLYHDMEYVGDFRLKFHEYRGAPPVRLSHVNIIVKDLEREIEFFSKLLGLYETEEFIDENGNRNVVWLSKLGYSHELAIAKSNKNVPGFHHFTYYVHDVKDIIRATDIIAAARLWDSIERGPGRHGVTQGYYVYFRDLDKNRIELFTADYLVLDPDKWKPIVWGVEKLRYRSDFWGRTIPKSWLEEWVPVEDAYNGELKRWV